MDTLIASAICPKINAQKTNLIEKAATKYRNGPEPMIGAR
jgi:hypothetical protein